MEQLVALAGWLMCCAKQSYIAQADLNFDTPCAQMLFMLHNLTADLSIIIPT
jgi:hypothetical protein